MELSINQSIDRDTLENIFVTALEGGSNYWYYLPHESILAIREAVPKSVDAYLSTAILKAILDHDVDVQICDAEDEDEVVGLISKSTMQERLQAMWNSPNRSILQAEIDGEGDADSSDVVFQYIAMGEVIYG
jgi:hypothetical protein